MSEHEDHAVQDWMDELDGVAVEQIRKDQMMQPLRHNHITRDIKMDGSCPRCNLTGAADDVPASAYVEPDPTQARQSLMEQGRFGLFQNRTDQMSFPVVSTPRDPMTQLKGWMEQNYPPVPERPKCDGDHVHWVPKPPEPPLPTREELIAEISRRKKAAHMKNGNNDRRAGYVRAMNEVLHMLGVDE